MALGLNTGGSAADIVPHVRYDARAGRLFRADRAQGVDGRWTSELVDISQPPPAFIMDLARIEVGWLTYSSSGPDMRLVPFGEPLPPAPSQEHKQGFRVRLFAPKLLGGLREFASNAKVVISAMDVLHSAFEAAPERSQGLVPVVVMAGTMPVTTKTPQGSSTNYSPVFRIEKWVPRPAELQEASHIPAPAAAAPAAPARSVSPPPASAQHVPPPPPVPAAAAPVHETEF